MNSKLERRAFFDWLKSSDEHLFSIAILVGLFAVRNEFSGDYRIGVYLLIALLIFLSGWGLIRTKLLERSYLEFLKDKRYQEKWYDNVKAWILLIIYILMGATIIYLAMDIWKEIFISTFSK